MKYNITLPGIIITNIGYAIGLLFVTYVLQLAIPLISIIFWIIIYNGWAAYQMCINSKRNSLAK